MDIIVCIKQVPNTTRVELDPKTHSLKREGVDSIVNPCDLVALEAALRLKRETNGHVTALSMGPAQAVQALREACARGADRAVLICDRVFAGADTLATAHTLARAVNSLGIRFDLVLCGLQAIDGDTGQVGPGLAALLDLPLLPNARKLDIDPSNHSARVERCTEDGIEILQARLPVLVTAEPEMADPGPLPGNDWEGSLSEIIEKVSFDALGGDRDTYGLAGSATWVERIGSPKPIAARRIPPELPPMERIRLILSGGLESKGRQQILRDTGAPEAVGALVGRMLNDGILRRPPKTGEASRS